MADDIESTKVTRNVHDAEHLSDLPVSSPQSPVPFDLLPTEIIMKIFISACPRISLPGQRQVIESRIQMVTSKSLVGFLVDPMILSMVCKRWRAITRTHPSMWATLTIHCSRIRKKAWKQWGLFKLRDYLERSASHPLKICIDGDDSSKSVISGILDVVIPHSKRWKDMTFDFPLGRRFLEKLDSLKGQLPLLETVHLYLSDTAGHRGSFLSSPSIKHVIFDPSEVPKSILRHIQWENISEVVFESSTFKHKQHLRVILEYLSISTMKLTLSRVTIDSLRRKAPLPAGTQAPIRLEKLRKLCLDGFHGLLDVFVCPYLERLEITGGYNGDEDEIVSFLDNSSCSLVDIHLSAIHRGPSNERLFYTIFHSSSLSTLKTISLDEPTDSILDLLIFDSYQVLPSLETLRLNLVFEIEGDIAQYLASRIDVLKQIVESRTQSTPSNEDKTSTTFDTTQFSFVRNYSLKNCFFTFKLEADQPRSENDGLLAETILETLQLFCISKKVHIQQDLIFQDGADSDSGSPSYDTDNDPAGYYWFARGMASTDAKI